MKMEDSQKPIDILFSDRKANDISFLNICSHPTTIKWEDWRDRSRLHGLGCMLMQIPYARICETLGDNSCFRLHYLIEDPRANLLRRLSKWYRWGSEKGAFVFYRVLRAKVDELGLESEISRRTFVKWLLDSNPHPLVNPQLYWIDPSKDSEKVAMYLDRDFYRVQDISPTTESGTKSTPLDFLDFEGEARALDVLIADELELYTRFVSESDRIEEDEETSCSHESSPRELCKKNFLRGMVRNVEKGRIEGKILFREIPHIPLVIQVRTAGKTIKRIPLKRETKRIERVKGGFRISFEVDGIPYRTGKRFSFLLQPCGIRLKFMNDRMGNKAEVIYNKYRIFV